MAGKKKAEEKLQKPEVAKAEPEEKPKVKEDPILVVSAPGMYAEQAYAKLRDEIPVLPPWEEASDRAQGLYLQAVCYVMDGGEPRTRFEEIVKGILF